VCAVLNVCDPDDFVSAPLCCPHSVPLCSSGGESDLQKCRNNRRQPKVRGQMMERRLPCDNTVWKGLWGEGGGGGLKGGSGFLTLSLFVVFLFVGVTKR